MNIDKSISPILSIPLLIHFCFKEAMKIKIFCIGVLLMMFTNSYSQNHKKDSIFILEKSMIKSFNVLNFEIELTDEAMKLCNETDFSSYNAIWVTNDLCIYPLHESTMALRPSYIYIYRNGKSIITSDGKIQIIAKHLGLTDNRVSVLKKALSNNQE